MAYSTVLTSTIAKGVGWKEALAAELATTPPTLTEYQRQALLAISKASDTSSPVVVTIPGDGAITIQNSIVGLTKGSAAAITIAAPTAAQEGTRILVTAGSSFAHVITGTNLFWAGQTGGPFNKVTLAAFIGASAKLVAYGLLWHVVNHSPGAATVGD